MKELNELVELANKANAAGQGTPEMVDFRVVANPDNILAIAEAFRALEQGRDKAEVEKAGAEERSRMMFDAKNHWADRARAAEVIVSDVNEVIGLLSDREWAEHCTKTETGMRLEELITELHDDAATANSTT